jgi:hypothetical protein
VWGYNLLKKVAHAILLAMFLPVMPHGRYHGNSDYEYSPSDTLHAGASASVRCGSTLALGSPTLSAAVFSARPVSWPMTSQTALRTDCRHQNFMSEISAMLSAAAQHSSRKLATAIANKHFFAHGVPDSSMLAAQKCKTDDKRCGSSKLLCFPLQWHTGPRALQIRCRLLQTLTEIAIENTAPDGK